MTHEGRLADEDPYEIMSKRVIFERLLAFTDCHEGITRRQLLDYCGATMPAIAPDISDAVQARLSRALWQMDRGYLKMKKKKGKNSLYLTIGGQRRLDQPKAVPVESGWAMDWRRGTLTWRQ
jgi:hypothetical protein